MTRSSNARLAGFGYLSNIVVGILNEVLMHRATRVDGTAATLARIADHLMELLEAGTDLTARDGSRDRCRTV
jgi:hypothetical protein